MKPETSNNAHATTSIPADAAQIQARLRRNLGKYFPEVANNQTPIELTQVSRRSYSNVYVFRTAAKGTKGEKGIAVKVFLPASGGPDAARLQYAALNSVWPIFRTLPTMTVPRPLDYFPEFSALVTESIQGRSLHHLFRTFRSLPGIDKGVLRLVYQCGQWLRKFHDATAIGSETLNLDYKFGLIRPKLISLRSAGFRLDLCEELEGRLESLGDEIRRVKFPMAAVHGDFTVDNVLFDGERIVTIDLGGKDRNAIHHDISTFLNSLALVGLTWPIRRSVLVKSRQQFLSGYFGSAEYFSKAIGFLRLVGLLSVALEIISRRRDQVLLRWWIQPYFARLLREMLEETRPVR